MPTDLKIVQGEIREMQPQPNIVSLLEGALEEARRGEFDGVVLLLSHPDGATSDRWATGVNFLWTRMLGCAAVWSHRYLKRFGE